MKEFFETSIEAAEQKYSSVNLLTFSSLLSIASVTIILFLMYYLKIRTQFSIYMKFLFFSNLCYSLLTILGRILPYTIGNSAGCNIIMVLSLVSKINAIYWTLSFAISMYFVIVKDQENISKYLRFHLIIANLIALPLALFPLFFNGYGVARHSSCGISYQLSVSSRCFLRIFTHYIPFLIAFSVAVFCYRAVMLRLRELEKTNIEIKAVSRQFLPYQLILFTGGFIGLTCDLWQIISGDYIDILYFFSLIVARLQGFFNALVYGCNRSIKEGISKKCFSGRAEEVQHSFSLTGEDSEESIYESLDSSDHPKL